MENYPNPNNTTLSFSLLFRLQSLSNLLLKMGQPSTVAIAVAVVRRPLPTIAPRNRRPSSSVHFVLRNRGCLRPFRSQLRPSSSTQLVADVVLRGAVNTRVPLYPSRRSESLHLEWRCL
ncbi:hypothetical protein PIB30_108968, partial [Stylosanthes scabra]|nr:hypothetical protein [Stylosanthes scabra]